MRSCVLQTLLLECRWSAGTCWFGLPILPQPAAISLALLPPAPASSPGSLPAPPLLQVWSAADEVRPLFNDIDRMVYTNLKRVQQAMRRHRIGPHHFSGSTGGHTLGCMHVCMCGFSCDRMHG